MDVCTPHVCGIHTSIYYLLTEKICENVLCEYVVTGNVLTHRTHSHRTHSHRTENRIYSHRTHSHRTDNRVYFHRKYSHRCVLQDMIFPRACATWRIHMCNTTHSCVLKWSNFYLLSLPPSVLSPCSLCISMYSLSVLTPRHILPLAFSLPTHSIYMYYSNHIRTYIYMHTYIHSIQHIYIHAHIYS